MTTVTEAVTLVDELMQGYMAEKRALNRIDAWARWDHETPHKPSTAATKEYKELAKRAQAPFGDLIVESIAQTLYVEGYRRPDVPDDATGWRLWQANGMDGRQVALHETIFRYGYAFGVGLPGINQFTGETMPVMRCFSPREMIAAYEDPAVDDWPRYALRVTPIRGGYRLQLFDEMQSFMWKIGAIGEMPKANSDVVIEDHNAMVCPVVRYKNRFDLEGRVAGEVEPFIPILGRIDQTAMDRLVVQRFGAWIVRWIAGMDVPASADASGDTVEEARFKLQMSDFLTMTDPDTKAGAFPATPLDGYIKAHDSDLAVLAAVSQTPAFELLGQMANLSAEALAAAKASQTAKSEQRKHCIGEDHEQFIRLACHLAGDSEGAADFMAEVRWADTSIRSLSQAVDALGKMAQMLGFPPELLWQKVPGFSKQDVDEAKKRLDETGGLDRLLAELTAMGTQENPDAAVTGAQF